jgi:NAD(P)-dependent dehydrogenase (short-subunit alcohol dehydrogenase family)
MRFTGSCAAVVGGADDIGRASALRFAGEGADVIIIDEDSSAVQRTCSEAETLGARSMGFDVDFSTSGEPAAVAARCRDSGYVIDVLVNGQNSITWGSIEDGDPSLWERTMQVNLLGPYLWTKAFLPHLKQSGHGSVVNLGSVDGLFGNPSVPGYSASKSGLLALTHVMAAEFAKYGIRVNLVCRVATTEFLNRVAHDIDVGRYQEQLASVTPLGRLGTPEESAAAVAFLSSADASFITGASLVVDGGRTAVTQGTI